MTVLMISGSTRSGSTNTATLRTAAESTPAVLYDGLSALPAFNPDDDRDPLPEPVAALRDAVTQSDAVLFCTPEYAGTLPGSLKNLLDWLVGSTALTDKPTAWIQVAAAGRGDGAHDTLRTVLGYLQARVVDAACLRMPVGRTDIDADGTLIGEQHRLQLAAALTVLTEAGPADRG